MDEIMTACGEIVRLGDRFRDRERTAVRTLRVDQFEADYDQMIVHCTIISERVGDTVTQTNRRTAMNVETLVGRNFVRVTETEVP